MTPHSQRAVNNNGVPTCYEAGFNARSQKPDATIEQYRNMTFRGGTPCCSVNIHCSPFHVVICASYIG
ncbi:hypothetical protein GCM10025778_19280 [Paeniglutamicibacter antarcticus]|uniref:Uncharacterized protein n=1 Tax=Paeniglutamicibacter antarcticus TaxID=494023 RepID=A0ABP9TQZ0_9MICC